MTGGQRPRKAALFDLLSQAAIGSAVGPADFARYMRFHERKLYRTARRQRLATLASGAILRKSESLRHPL